MDRRRLLFTIWNWLPAFQAVAEAEHLPTASKRLRLTPSALSRTITMLEDRVGRELFARKGRALALNAHGRRLLSGMTSAYAALSASLAALSSGELEGPVYACACGPLAQVLVVPALRELQQQKREARSLRVRVRRRRGHRLGPGRAARRRLRLRARRGERPRRLRFSARPRTASTAGKSTPCSRASSPAPRTFCSIRSSRAARPRTASRTTRSSPTSSGGWTSTCTRATSCSIFAPRGTCWPCFPISSPNAHVQRGHVAPASFSDIAVGAALRDVRGRGGPARARALGHRARGAIARGSGRAPAQAGAAEPSATPSRRLRPGARRRLACDGRRSPAPWRVRCGTARLRLRVPRSPQERRRKRDG